MQLTREGPGADEVQIIGVELAVTPAGQYGGGQETELDMFACRHTLPAIDQNHGYQPRSTIRVTLHTSRGDVTLTGVAPSW